MKIFDAYAKYYDLLYQDKDYREESEYIIKLIERAGTDRKKILDLGCGTGKHNIYFARRGYEVTGIEISEKMLGIASKNLDAETGLSSKLKFIRGDIRDVRLPEKFDIITSLFHVINYQILNEDLRSLLKTVKAHLKENGKFIFDFWYGPGVLNERPECRIKKMQNKDYLVERHAAPVLHINENTADINYRIIIKELNSGEIQEEHETHRMRYLFLPELNLLFDEVEMKIEHSEEWMSGNVLSDRSWYALVIAGNK
ncbi:MAG: class I SAM-dependent methyltransferase [Ignavibacteria bacterium]|nr:class I SAM-dependent methyltransferase [Ignavibacteria bacterium]